jgi:hypothetical protein
MACLVPVCRSNPRTHAASLSVCFDCFPPLPTKRTPQLPVELNHSPVTEGPANCPRPAFLLHDSFVTPPMPHNSVRTASVPLSAPRPFPPCCACFSRCNHCCTHSVQFARCVRFLEGTAYFSGNKHHGSSWQNWCKVLPLRRRAELIRRPPHRLELESRAGDIHQARPEQQAGLRGP